MRKRIECVVEGEYITLTTRVAGASGSYGSAELYMSFDERWENTIKRLYMTDALGHTTVQVLVTADMLDVEGFYTVTIPAEPLKYSGDFTLNIKGSVVNAADNITESVIMAAQTRLQVLPAKTEEASGEPEPPPTPSELEKIQQQIENLTDDIQGALEAVETTEANATRAETAADEAETAAASIGTSVEDAKTAAQQAQASASEAASSASSIQGIKTEVEGIKTDINGLVVRAETAATSSEGSATQAANSASAANVSASTATGAVSQIQGIADSMAGAIAGAVVDATVQANQAATSAQTSASTASTKATEAQASATSAQNSAEQAQTTANNIQASVSASVAEATSQAERATTQANRSETEADRAKREADRAGEIVGGDYATKTELSTAITTHNNSSTAHASVIQETVNTAIAGSNFATDEDITSGISTHNASTTAHSTLFANNLASAKEYTNQEIAKIPAPDVSAQIQSHNTSDTAHEAKFEAKADLVGGKVPASQLPVYVDDTQEYASLAEFPATGASGIIYIETNTNKTYLWGGSTYVSTDTTLAIGNTADTAHRGDHGSTAYTHSQTTGNPHNTTAAQVGADPSGSANAALASANQHTNTQIATREPAFNKNTAFNKNFGTASGTVAQGNDSRFPPTTGTTGYVLTKTSSGQTWQASSVGSVVSPSKGGTGLSSPTAGKFLKTNGSGNMTLADNFSLNAWELISTQTLASKTFSVNAKLGYSEYLFVLDLTSQNYIGRQYLGVDAVGGGYPLFYLGSPYSSSGILKGKYVMRGTVISSVVSSNGILDQTIIKWMSNHHSEFNEQDFSGNNMQFTITNGLSSYSGTLKLYGRKY